MRAPVTELPGDKLAVNPGLKHQFGEEQLRAASTKLADGVFQTDFIVPEMRCVGCIRAIERGLAKLSHVNHVRANLSNRQVSVTWNGADGSANDIDTAITELGFEHTPFDLEASEETETAATGKRLLQSLSVAGFAAANIMLLSVSVWSGAEAETARLFHLISGLIAVPAVAFAGRPFFSSALKAISAGRLNMDVPISVAVILALGMSIFEATTGGKEAYFDAAVTLLFFLLIGRYLDHLMREKARSAVTRLAQIAPKNAVLVDTRGKTCLIPVQDIVTGMRLRIMPGERLPTDGKLVEGKSDVDRSLVTGESAARLVNPGDQLESGVLNLNGAIDIVATASAHNSFLAEVVKMMGAAELGRDRYTRIADRMAAIYAPAVHLLALFTFVGWMIWSGGAWHQSIYAAISVLIITCPCALGLAVPVVHVIGAKRLFDAGIMIRDGSAFERLSEIDTVIFDKTGTLTIGLPKVANISGPVKGHEPTIASLVSRSSHPAAGAVKSHFQVDEHQKIGGIHELPGFGIEASVNGKLVRFGRASWVAEIAGHSDAPPSGSESIVGFAEQNKPPIWFFLEDTLRNDAVEAVERLRRSNLKLEILSGDNVGPVSSAAQVLGISAVRASVTPKEKIDRVLALQENGRKVLMVGDGLNDAPALAAGHVSMAPASASDVGRLASDLVFTRQNLLAVPFSHAISLQTSKLVRQNFGLAIVYNCIAIPLAMAGYVTPLVAAIAMSASSLLVIANSMRLYLGERQSGVSENEIPAGKDHTRFASLPANSNSPVNA